MHHEDAQPIVASQPAAGRFGIVVALGIGALASLSLAASVYVSMGGQAGLGLVMAALALWMFVLFLYVLRDAQGKLGWRIEIGSDAVTLLLPSGRSLIHRLSAVDTRIPYDTIEAIETRLEAYRSFGLANMQRSFALKLKDGRLVILGEDRALGTRLASSLLEDTVAKIIERGGMATRDLGMAEGKGGILGVLFTAPPPWGAPGLSDDQQTALWGRATMTGKIGLVFSLIVGLLAAINILSS